MCVRARTHVGAAIFVQSGAEGALKICVGVHTCIKYLKINTNLVQQGLEIHGLEEHGPWRYTVFNWFPKHLRYTDFGQKP